MKKMHWKTRLMLEKQAKENAITGTSEEPIQTTVLVKPTATEIKALELMTEALLMLPNNETRARVIRASVVLSNANLKVVTES